MGTSMVLQKRMELFIKKIARFLNQVDPMLVDRSQDPPKLEENPKRKLAASFGTTLGVQIEDNRILLPKVPEILLEAFYMKVAADWLFLPYLQRLPDPAHQLSFLTPCFFLKKAHKGIQEWESLWREVFPTPIYYGGYPEFSREYLLRIHKFNDILFFYDIHTCFRTLEEQCVRLGLATVPLDMFLETFFDQLLSVKKLNRAEKRMIARAIELGSLDIKLLGSDLNLPRSTTYKLVSSCQKKTDLVEHTPLKLYCLELEPILIIFPEIKPEEADFVEPKFRTLPYLQNVGRYITSTKEHENTNQVTLLIHLGFPGRFTHALRDWIKKFTQLLPHPEFSLVSL